MNARQIAIDVIKFVLAYGLVVLWVLAVGKDLGVL